ncbi:MAG: hypothetical protein WDM86_07985 [Rhizomicrobium sp.]
MSGPHFPLLELAVEPRTAQAQARLDAALPALKAADPLFDFATDSESGQTLLRGASEAQLASRLAQLKDRHGIALASGALQVVYRETLSGPATVTYAYKKAEGQSGQFAVVTVRFEPLPEGSGFEFADATAGHPIPPDFVPAVRRGIESQMPNGPLAGFPLVDVKATLLDGRYHEIDSNELTFEIAARGAVRRLADEGVAVLLEPVMRLEISAPADRLGDVVEDLTARRATILQTEEDGPDMRLVAEAPLAGLFGYGAALAVLSQGQARCVMTFSHYARVPRRDDPDPRFPGAAAMRVA